MTFTPTPPPRVPLSLPIWDLESGALRSRAVNTPWRPRSGCSPKAPADSTEPGHAHRATMSTPQSRGQGWPPAPQTGEGQVQVQAGTTSASSAPPAGCPPTCSHQWGLRALSTTPLHCSAGPQALALIGPRGQGPHPEMHRPASGGTACFPHHPGTGSIYVHTPTHVTRAYIPTHV